VILNNLGGYRRIDPQTLKQLMKFGWKVVQCGKKIAAIGAVTANGQPLICAGRHVGIDFYMPPHNIDLCHWHLVALFGIGKAIHHQHTIKRCLSLRCNEMRVQLCGWVR
jgi:hypothetical protein